MKFLVYDDLNYGVIAETVTYLKEIKMPRRQKEIAEIERELNIILQQEENIKRNRTVMTLTAKQAEGLILKISSLIPDLDRFRSALTPGEIENTKHFLLGTIATLEANIKGF